METEKRFYQFEALGVLALPPQEDQYQNPLDGTKHPLIAELNSRLKLRKGNLPETASHASETAHAKGVSQNLSSGHPFHLSAELVRYAQKLSAAGEEELALEVLDEGFRWEGTQVSGVNYQNLAIQSADNGKPNLAIAIALDNKRILAHEKPYYLNNMPRNENSPLAMVMFAGAWLRRGTLVYQAVQACKVLPDAALQERFLEQIDLYSEVVAANCSNRKLPRSVYASPNDTNWAAVKLGEACASLYKAGDTKRAAFLEQLDPDIPAYTER